MLLRKKLTLIAVLGSLLITLPALFALYYLARDSYLEQTLAQLAKTTRANASIPIDHIRRAETSLITLADELRLSLSQPPLASELDEFDKLVSTDEHGVTRNNSNLFDGQRQAGVFIPADVNVTDDVKRTKLRAMKLLSRYGQAALQFFDGVWFDQADKTSVIFWRRDADFIYQLAPDHDYTQTLWNTLASPELNPERTPKWTPPIQESPVGTWVVSCVYPLDIDGNWLGVLGHDIALTELITGFTQQDAYQHSQHFLIDAYGSFILAGPWQQQLEQASGEFKPDLSQEPELQALFNGDLTLDGNHYDLSLHNQHYVAFSLTLPGLDWRYYRLVLIDELLAPMHQLFIDIAVLLILIALLSTILMNQAVRRLFIHPLTQFAKTAYDYGHGLSDSRINYPKHDELGNVASTFNQMADNIQQQQQTLQKSQGEYSHVINTINEAIFKLDNNGRVQFVNAAWQQLTGHVPSSSIDRFFTDFIHPESLIDVETAIEATLDDPSFLFHGEIKLLNRHQQSIWVELEMQASIEPKPHAGEQLVITGHMDNITTRKYTQLIDSLINTLERQAMQGRHLEHILGIFCIELSQALSLPLVWVVRPTEHTHRVIAAAGEAVNQVNTLNQRLLSDSEQWQQFSTSTQPQTLTTDLTVNGIGDSLVIPLCLPNDDSNAIVLFHTGLTQHFSEHDTERLAKLTAKIAIIIQLAEDQKWMLLHRTAVETTANAILITDNNANVEWCNEAFSRLTGYSLESIQGKNPRIFASGQQDASLYQEMWQYLSNKKIWRGELINQRKDGSLYSVVQTITPLIDDRGEITHFVAVQEDISELKAAEQRMQYLATHDFLTDLPNRFMLKQRLDHAIETGQRQQHAVLFMDLDGFKNINDSLGHHTGDMILQQLAQRLSSLLSQADTLARIGGDEFVILVENIANIESINDIAMKVLENFKHKFDIQGNQLKLTTSIGISLYPHDGTTSEQLLSHADAAMYHAKEQGRNNIQFFTQSINDTMQARLTLEQDLQTALHDNQFELHYQPQIDLEKQTVAGVEALLRWHHPERGMISPLTFIPFAEDTGQIIDIGNWVLKTACQQAKQWHQQGYGQLNVSVNVSVRQLLHSEFISSVHTILTETMVNPKLITIELTESIMVTKPEHAIKLLNQLKALGLKLSIDDFGTGYSSLQYLKLLPLDELKIDQSFIRDIEHKDGYAIVKSICALGHSMGLSLLAEGIEQVSTPAVLQELGCHHCQGYLFSKPLSVQDVTDYFASHY
ncbi:MAG: EAL domain-containing protein [Gammaproteobacteria bacterium]|nr:EAL domain-containing protein [Gammaproteobacteria bacterium]